MRTLLGMALFAAFLFAAVYVCGEGYTIIAGLDAPQPHGLFTVSR